jgi:hypothetical protein
MVLGFLVGQAKIASHAKIYAWEPNVTRARVSNLARLEFCGPHMILASNRVMPYKHLVSDNSTLNLHMYSVGQRNGK